MNYFFITGSSQGLGLSLTKLLLKDNNNFVYGFSRNNDFSHQNYQHTTLDLGDLNKVKTFQFPVLSNTDSIVLINNAGIVGDVNYVGKVNNDEIIKSYSINLIAPSILTNNFIASYTSSNSDKLILNISSGAGRSAIDGWNVYCATKAGLDMFSQVLKEEALINGSNLNILSLAPGIIDTGMQETIRTSSKEGFSNIERFIEYKENGDLAQPEDTATIVARFIFEKGLQQNVICSVRDVSE